MRLIQGNSLEIVLRSNLFETWRKPVIPNKLFAKGVLPTVCHNVRQLRRQARSKLLVGLQVLFTFILLFVLNTCKAA